MNREPADIQRIKSILESLLLVASEPLTYDDIKNTLASSWQMTTKEILDLMTELREGYEAALHGFQITEIAGKFQICTDPKNAEWVKQFLRVRNAEGLSKPALETLAIIAYRQPITKLEVEGIRGVNVDGVLKKLCDKGLIRTRGKKEILGHPFLFVTTEKFLEYFGLRSLEDLPQKEELNGSQLKERKDPDEQKSDEQTSETAAENRSN